MKYIIKTHKLGRFLVGHTIRKYKSNLPGLADEITFNDTLCFFPNKFECDVADDTGHMTFTNNTAEAVDTILVFELLGSFYCLGDGQGGCWHTILDAGETVEVGITAMFGCEQFPESQTVLLTWWCGIYIDETSFVPTDSIGYDVYISHPKIDWMQIAIIGGVIVGIGIMGFALMKKQKTSPIIIQGMPR